MGRTWAQGNQQGPLWSLCSEHLALGSFYRPLVGRLIPWADLVPLASTLGWMLLKRVSWLTWKRFFSFQVSSIFFFFSGFFRSFSSGSGCLRRNEGLTLLSLHVCEFLLALNESWLALCSQVLYYTSSQVLYTNCTIWRKLLACLWGGLRIHSCPCQIPCGSVLGAWRLVSNLVTTEVVPTLPSVFRIHSSPWLVDWLPFLKVSST